MSNVLVHHGIKGQRWGIRRFQNKDGSLTLAGKRRKKSEGRQEVEEQKRQNNPFQDLQESRLIYLVGDPNELEVIKRGKELANKVGEKRLKEIMDSPELKASRHKIENYISEDNKLLEDFEATWENAFNDIITEEQASREADRIRNRREELRKKMKVEDTRILSMFE